VTGEVERGNGPIVVVLLGLLCRHEQLRETPVVRVLRCAVGVHEPAGGDGRRGRLPPIRDVPAAHVGEQVFRVVAEPRGDPHKRRRP
jgi:hypothetical protein